MDLQIFIVWLTLAIILTLVGFFFMGNIGIVCGFVGGSILVMLGLLIGSGTPITNTIYFDPTSSVVQNIDIGLAPERVMILFILVGIYDFFIGFRSLKVF